MATAEELKALGNTAIAQKEYDQAIEHFTQAISLEPSNHILYSNRSAAYASKKEWENALQDAQKTTEIKPDWAKGFGRKGAALHGSGDLQGAREAYEEGLKLDPTSAQLKSGLSSIEKALNQDDDSSFGVPTGGIGKMFSDPRLIEKIAANPQTSAFLADPAFMMQLQSLKHNPTATDIFGDPRMLQVLGVLMGINLNVSAGPEGSADREAARFTGGSEQDVDMPDPRNPRQTSRPQPEPVVEELDEETIAKNQAQQAADEEKRLGTEQYKKRNFEAAIGHFTKAWELHKDITYLNNLGAAYFEKGDYNASIEACTKAVEEGREIYADFKIVAKSYARIGTAYEKLGDLGKAIEFYQKSLTEHRTPEVLNKLRTAERNKIETSRQAYISPEKAEEAREEGNKKFKECDWPGAVTAYSEMIKRAPDDPRGYGNRAAAFIKLFEFPSALDDCNQAIKKDPAFIRGHLRKAQAYFGMRKYSECVDTCAEAHVVDNEHYAGANAKEIEQQQQKAFSAMYSSRENETEEQSKERIMKDPDIMGIMQDPVMNAILQQAQSDPAALSEHMKNPGVRTKIQKLIAAGVIRLGR